MPTYRPGNARSLLVIVGLSLAGVAAAQRFVWPPSAGDRAASDRAALERATADQAASERAALPIDALQPSPTPIAERAVVYTDPGLQQPTSRALPSAPPASQLDWKILENPNGPHSALIFDPVRQVFAVYHVDSASGRIMLKSVRSLSADLQLQQLNSGNPAPKEIQAMLDEAR